MKKNFLFIALSVLFVGLAFSSCKKDDSGNNVTDNGKTDPSTIATANLIAYFPFESATNSIDATVSKGITLGQVGGAASFATGRRGNAYQGNINGAYLTYNLSSSNNPLLNLKAFTIAAWIKTPPAILPSDGSNGAAIICQLDGGDVTTMGNLDFMIQSNSTVDSLNVYGYLFKATATWQGQSLGNQNPAFLSDKWVHVVYSYDNTTSTMALYASGLPVFTSIRYADDVQPDGSQPLLGDLSFGQDMSKLYIGAWFQLVTNNAVQDWMHYYPGMIDELRIYNRALTDTEVKALYDAEVTQITSTN